MKANITLDHFETLRPVQAALAAAREKLERDIEATSKLIKADTVEQAGIDYFKRTIETSKSVIKEIDGLSAAISKAAWDAHRKQRADS